MAVHAASLGEVKLKMPPPRRANSRQMPPVMPAAHNMSLVSFLTPTLPKMISLTARNPNNGMATSATMSMEDTDLNLLYIGKKLKKNFVSHMQLFPHASITEKTVPIRSPHL